MAKKQKTSHFNVFDELPLSDDYATILGTSNDMPFCGNLDDIERFIKDEQKKKLET